jgi:hypothetical protein
VDTYGVLPIAGAPHIPGDTVRVGQICLDGDGGERFLSDEAFGDFRSLSIELVGAMGGLTQEDKTCLANALQQRVIISSSSSERVGALANTVDYRRGHAFHVSCSLALSPTDSSAPAIAGDKA